MLNIDQMNVYVKEEMNECVCVCVCFSEFPKRICMHNAVSFLSQVILLLECGNKYGRWVPKGKLPQLKGPSSNSRPLPENS